MMPYIHPKIVVNLEIIAARNRKLIHHVSPSHETCMLVQSNGCKLWITRNDQATISGNDMRQPISCQDGKSLRKVENGRYDFQIITFQDLKNAPVIADSLHEAAQGIREDPSAPRSRLGGTGSKPPWFTCAATHGVARLTYRAFVR
jgi:hypothetical protein